MEDKMKYCLFIPTMPKHFQYIDKILSKYKEGTDQPDEIIISISEAHKIKDKDIDMIKSKYNCKIIKHNVALMAGPNRQYATTAKSDVIIYHDSDDLPHKQRIEIIKYFFETYDIVALNHAYYFNFKLPKVFLDNININDIKFIKSDILFKKYLPNNNLKESFKHVRAYGSGFGFPITAGAVSIKKEVLSQVKWKDSKDFSFCRRWDDPKSTGGEDYEFCMETLQRYNKSILINAYIYNFRMYEK